MVNSTSAILVYKNKILLFLRDDIPTISDPNTWNLPGGEIEEGEDFQAGCIREIEEEVNIKLDGLTQIDEFTWPGKTTKHKSYFKKLTDEEAQSARLGNEGQKIAFFSFEELADLKLSGIIRYKYNETKDYIKKIMETERPEIVEHPNENSREGSRRK